jgi:hypothetical protein
MHELRTHDRYTTRVYGGWYDILVAYAAKEDGEARHMTILLKFDDLLSLALNIVACVYEKVFYPHLTSTQQMIYRVW